MAITMQTSVARLAFSAAASTSSSAASAARISSVAVTEFRGSQRLGSTLLPDSQALRSSVRAVSVSRKALGAAKQVGQAVATANGTGVSHGLPIDLRGKRAFIAGVADDQGFGWGMAKALSAAGAEILVGTWVPKKKMSDAAAAGKHHYIITVKHTEETKYSRKEEKVSSIVSNSVAISHYPSRGHLDVPKKTSSTLEAVALNIFESSLRRGKFDASRALPNGGMLEIAKVYPLDAVFDTPEDVPEDIKNNKRYSGSSKWTVQEVAEAVKADYGSIDILVHSLANGPEVTKPLLETSRKGYLAAISASSYSYVSLLKYFAPIMNPGGSSISLTYLASERIIPGYGGGMSSAKAALECDTRLMAFEAGRKHGIRVNTISAGPLRSRAAKAIGFIDDMINYSTANAPLQKELEADDVGYTAAFLASPLAGSITGTVIYVDNGLHSMGLAVDSPCVSKAAAPPSEKTNVPA